MINKVIDTEQGRIEIDITENDGIKRLNITLEEHPGVFKDINIH
ncbi:hypothetical protein [Sinomicrobium sp. M5D2P17]